MNNNPTIAELAAEVTDLVDRCGATEFQLQELIDADLSCRLDDTQSTVDDLEYRLTEQDVLIEALEYRLARLEGQSFLARLFRKGVK